MMIFAAFASLFNAILCLYSLWLLCKNDRINRAKYDIWFSITDTQNKINIQLNRELDSITKRILKLEQQVNDK